MREAAVGYDEFVNRRYGVAADFGSLAVDAVTRPSGDVGSEGWPDEFVSHHLPCALNARVSQAVDAVEDAATPREGHEGSRRSIGDINEEIEVSYGDFSKCEAGIGVV